MKPTLKRWHYAVKTLEVRSKIDRFDTCNGNTVAENSIPADLILNWDQRGMRMVPVNNWTMTTRGSKRVSVTGLGDKRDTFSSNICPFLNWRYTSKVDFVLVPIRILRYHSAASRTNYTNV